MEEFAQSDEFTPEPAFDDLMDLFVQGRENGVELSFDDLLALRQWDDEALV